MAAKETDKIAAARRLRFPDVPPFRVRYLRADFFVATIISDSVQMVTMPRIAITMQIAASQSSHSEPIFGTTHRWIRIPVMGIMTV